MEIICLFQVCQAFCWFCLVVFFQLEQDILLHILQTFIQTNSAFIVTVYIGFPKKLLSLRSESSFLFTLGFVFLLCFVVRCGCITVPASQILQNANFCFIQLIIDQFAIAKSKCMLQLCSWQVLPKQSLHQYRHIHCFTKLPPVEYSGN